MRQQWNSARRLIAREPGFAAVVVLTLAIGIGANTAIFSVVNSILLRPLAFRQPDRLVAINEVIPKLAQLYPVLPVNLSHYFDWRRQATSFESIGLWEMRSMNLTGAGEPALLRGVKISANAFQMLGVSPMLGRVFTEPEDRSGQGQLVILSHALWTQRFQANRAVVGRKILLDGSPYIVVGVMPAGFRLPWPTGLGVSGASTAEIQFFKPLGYSGEDLKDRLGEFNWTAVGRLRPGVNIEKARSELNVIQSAISATLEENVDLRGAIEPLRNSMVGDSRRGLLLVMGAVGAALLVLCVNLANLWFARAAGRSREIAIRVALGAGRGRVIGQLLTESVTLSVAGGILGVALAYAALSAIVSLAPADLPRLEEVHMDGLALGFAIVLSLGCGVLFGVLPALRMARQDPQEALKSGSHSNTEGVRGVWVRKILVAAEVGLSTILLITAGLLIRSFDRLINVNRGYDVERVLAVDLALPSTKYTKPEQQADFYRRALAKVQGLPGVLSASLVSALPLQGETWVDLVGTEKDPRPMFQRPSANVRFISQDYFKTLGATLRAGRMFNDSDRDRKVAIVSQSVVQRLWPGQDAIGRKIEQNDRLEDIVGVAPDLRSTSLDKEPVNMVYIPYWQRPRLAASLLLRTAMDPRSVENPVRRAIWSLDADVPVAQMRTLVELMDKSVAQRRFNMALVLTFAISALALASFGVYGVLAYSVVRRRNEIGIRMALGAGSAQVRGLILRQGMQPVAIGLAAGVLASLAVGKLLSSLLFQVSPRDPLTVLLVVFALCAVAGAASIVPTIRAVRVNPITALRCD